MYSKSTILLYDTKSNFFFNVVEYFLMWLNFLNHKSVLNCKIVFNDKQLQPQCYLPKVKVTSSVYDYYQFYKNSDIDLLIWSDHKVKSRTSNKNTQIIKFFTK